MRSNRLAFIVACFAFVLGCACARGQSNVVRKTNYYAMTGSSIRDIQLSLRQTRPWKTGHDGSTEWRIQWNAFVSRNGDQCHCTSFETTTMITVTLPKWIPPTNTPPAVREAWAKYLRALEQHEAGHADIALAATAEMHKRTKAIGAEADCDALRTKVKTECDAILEVHRAREKEYDQQTRHGATQGARLGGPRPDGRRRDGERRPAGVQ
jgi:predicted secreted Zn-dependent protease